MCIAPTVASYSGLLTPVFVACSANMEEGLVKVIMCYDVPGRVEEWHIPRKPQVSECATDCKHRP